MDAQQHKRWFRVMLGLLVLGLLLWAREAQPGWFPRLAVLWS